MSREEIIAAVRPLVKIEPGSPAEIRARGFKIELSDPDSNKVAYVHIIPDDEGNPGVITFTLPNKKEFKIAEKECQTHADMLHKKMLVNGDSITIFGVDPVHASMITRGLEQQGALSLGTADVFHDKLMAALDDWRLAYGNPTVTKHVKTQIANLNDYYQAEGQAKQLPVGPPAEESAPPARAPNAEAKMPSTATRPFVSRPDDSNGNATKNATLDIKDFYAEVEKEYNETPKSAQQVAGNPQVKKLMKFAADQARKGVQAINAVAYNHNVAAEQKAQTASMSQEKRTEILQQNDTIKHS